MVVSASAQHAVRDMAGGHVLPCRFDVFVRVVEKDVGAKCFQKRAFVAPAEKQRFIQTHAPMPQGQDHALVRRVPSGRSPARCGSATDRVGRRIAGWHAGRTESPRNGPARKRFGSTRSRSLRAKASMPCSVLIRVRIHRQRSPRHRQRRCAVARSLWPWIWRAGWSQRQRLRSSARRHIIGIGGQEELCTEWLDVGRGRRAIGESRADDLKP
jgi:hypothetical protein